MSRETPKEKLARHLREQHNLPCESEDINCLKGYWTHKHQDCLDRWTALVSKEGKTIEITGLDTVTKCARFGVTLEENHPDSEWYGDLIASPKIRIDSK